MSEGASRVIVVLGSPADMPWAERISAGLKRFDVAHEITVASAHKTPEFLLQRLREWEGSIGTTRLYHGGGSLERAFRLPRCTGHGAGHRLPASQ